MLRTDPELTRPSSSVLGPPFRELIVDEPECWEAEVDPRFQ